MHAKVAKAGHVLGFFCLSFAIAPAAASAWNQATHAYVAERVSERVGDEKLQAMWGSVAPDLINFVFDPALCPGWVADQTHGLESESFLQVWNVATAGPEVAMAYGFLTHNQVWGADHTAHVSSRTFGEGVGYVIAKSSALLDASFTAGDRRRSFDEAFANLGIDDRYARTQVAHLVVEYAIDILLRNDVDPTIGRELAAAAHGEANAFTDLLVRAFGTEYAATCFGGDASAAARAWTEVERRHRTDMIYLGQAISRPEPVAVRLVAEKIARVVAAFLGAALPEPAAIETIEAAIDSAMESCADYTDELDWTIELVARNLTDRGIVLDSALRSRPGG